MSETTGRCDAFPTRRGPRGACGLSPRAAAALLGLALALWSCAYYNTFYLARKYYGSATGRLPYIVDKPERPDGTATNNFRKSIEYSKKVLGQYPKSKWVDDAYLLWAQGLLATDDPLQTINMLRDFDARYPKSPVAAEARFYLGVASRQARKYRDAVRAFDEFLEMAPKHHLAPYAQLERARALGPLGRWEEAEAAAGAVIERFPKSGLLRQARLARADAAFNRGDYAQARADYVELGRNARSDEERLAFLFREADCLEAAHDHDQELKLLRDAQAHEVPPPAQTQSSTPGVPPPPPPANDRYGRIMIRIGTAHLLAGRQEDALTAYRSVVRDYPRTPIAAEAQYRVGYAFETVADDFVRAREEYARVKDIGVSSAFMAQAEQRNSNLGRITQYKGGGRDTMEAKAEIAFLLAEQYLFQLGKPDRALQEYHRIEESFAGTSWQAKAMLAQAWVLDRKLERRAEADSILWRVVREHAATEAQLAARDYLESEGVAVPESLIKLPEKPRVAAAPDTALTPPPAATDSLGPRRPGGPRLPGYLRNVEDLPIRARLPGADSTGAPADSVGGSGAPEPRPDSASAPPAASDSSAAPRSVPPPPAAPDSTVAPRGTPPPDSSAAPPDSAGARKPDGR